MPSIHMMRLRSARSTSDILAAFTYIPAETTNLYFHESDFALYLTEADDLKKILARVPPTVTLLDLYGCSLCNEHMKSGDKLGDALAALPGTVKELSLRKNNLHLMRGPELGKALAKIPNTVTTLGLGSNQFGFGQSLAEIIDAFAKIPASVTTLELAAFFLESSVAFRDRKYFTAAELIQIIEALPQTITEISIENQMGSGDTKNGLLPRHTIINQLQAKVIDELKRETAMEKSMATSSFYLECLMNVVFIGGAGALLAVAIMALEPIGLLGAAIFLAGAAVTEYSTNFFGRFKPTWQHIDVPTEALTSPGM